MKKIISAVLVIFLCASLFCGCTYKSAQKDTQAISLVLGVHKYYPSLNLNSKVVYDEIYDTCYGYGALSVILVDGSPYLYGDYKFTPPEGKSIDTAKRRQIAKQNTEQIIAESSMALAKTPEIDTLKSITMAADSLKSKGISNMTIVVLDSGLSTTGLLNFARENLINVDPTDIVMRLQELHAIPDLNGIHVLWTGIGEVAGEQSRLTESYRYKLLNIWKSIIEAGGGTVDFDKSPLSRETTLTNLPDCSTIPIIEDSLNLVGADLSNPIRFDENTSVKFYPDKAEFIDPVAAKEELIPIADYLRSNPGVSILIVGTTATSGSEEYRNNLSNMRAEACKSLLNSLGVSNAITTLGIGSKPCSLHADDLNYDGSLNERIAPQNRAVYIMDANSTTANEVRGLR